MFNDLIIFLASCVDAMADSRHKALACKTIESMRSALALEFPVVQGLESQMQISKIASMPYNGEKAYEQGVEFLKPKAPCTHGLITKKANADNCICRLCGAPVDCQTREEIKT